MTSTALRSGSWAGHYRQHGKAYPQQLRLEFADGIMRGSGNDDIGRFAIDGEFRVVDGEVRLGWIKTYERAHSVLYLGAFDGEQIVGRWDIRGYGDAFALTFAPAAAQRQQSRRRGE